MNTEKETLVTTIPDYACSGDGGSTVIVCGGIKGGKVVEITIIRGRINEER